jgi:tRNA(Ile)-lysidine synthase
MRLESDFWEGQVRQVCSLWGITADAERLTLPVKAFRDLHEALQRRLVKFLLESRSAGKNGIHQIHIEQILQLIREGRSGTKISLPFRTEAVHYYDHIIIRPESRETLARHQGSSNLRLPREPAVVNPQQVVETIPADIKMEETGLCLRMTLTDPPEKGYSAHAAYIDFYRIKFPLLVRTMLPGDRFHPLGLQGTKKLKTFYIDRKIPREIRGRIPLLVDQVGILWIGGMTISEDVKVTPLTRACLKIEII